MYGGAIGNKYRADIKTQTRLFRKKDRRHRYRYIRFLHPPQLIRTPSRATRSQLAASAHWCYYITIGL